MGDHRDDSGAGTRLLVRANQTDLGQRPISPSWQSPDILQTEGEIIEVRENVPVQLVARVFNVGTEPALNVHVNFWWANSALAISKASATEIGESDTKTVTINAPEEFICNVSWIPQALNSGAHPCIIVEAAGANSPVYDS